MDPHFSFPQFVAPAAFPFQNVMQAVPAAHAHTNAAVARVSKRVREEEASQTVNSTKRLKLDQLYFLPIHQMPAVIAHRFLFARLSEFERGNELITMTQNTQIDLSYIQWILVSGPISLIDFSKALGHSSLGTSWQINKPSAFHLINEACPEILRDLFSPEDRGNFLLAALDAPFDNASIIQTIKESGLILKQHQSKALWKAAKAEPPKPECLKVLNWGSKIEEVEEETKEDGVHHYSHGPKHSKRIKQSHSDSVSRINIQAALLWQLVSPMLEPKESLSFRSVNKPLRSVTIQLIQRISEKNLGTPLEALHHAIRQNTPKQFLLLLKTYCSKTMNEAKRNLFMSGLTADVENEDALKLFLSYFEIDRAFVEEAVQHLETSPVAKSTISKILNLFLLSEDERGALYIETARAPCENEEELTWIKKSGPISEENQGKALVTAASAEISKPQSVSFLSKGTFDEGGLLEERDEDKEDRDALGGDDINSSMRSAAVLEAVKRGYIDVVDALLSEVNLLDRDDDMIEALNEAILLKRKDLVDLLIEKSFYLDADREEAVEFGKEHGLDDIVEGV